MDERYFNKFVAYAIGVIIAYYILTECIQFVVWGVVGLVIFRIFMEYERRKLI